jgi:hypothetical protein
MSDNIVNLDDHRPHKATYVACLVCGHDWVAVAPVRHAALPMPSLSEDERHCGRA